MSNFIYVLNAIKDFINGLFYNPAISAAFGALATQLFISIREKKKQVHENKLFINDKIIDNILKSYVDIRDYLFKFRPIFIELTRIPEEDRSFEFKKNLLDFRLFIARNDIFMDESIYNAITQIANKFDEYVKPESPPLSNEVIDIMSDFYHKKLDSILKMLKKYSGISYVHSFLRENLNIHLKDE